MATTLLDLPDELILHSAEMLYIHLGKELVFGRFTKTVDIMVCDPRSFDPHMAGLQLLIDLAPTLTNLQSLKWSYWITKPSVLPLIVKGLDLLGSIPGLKELIIEIAISDPSPGFTFKPFSNLSLVSVHWIHEGDITQDFSAGLADLLGRCPNLEKFTFSVPRPYHPSKVPSFTHIFSLPSTTYLKLRHLDLTGIYVSADDFRVHLHHLRSLKILHLMFNRLLLDNSIYLDEFAIDTTHPPNVLKYLSSYSGLEHLKFQSRYPGADSPENIHRFFSLVLPLHRATLRVLHLGWSVETLWTRDIPPEELAQIEKCQQLTRISCYITVAVGRTGRTDKLMVGGIMGHYYYDDEEEFGLEMEVKKFAVNKVEKFKAEHAVPFVMKASSAPSLGP
ncbi:hypothetical protein AGABI1DRAFT_89062 [Agaricus bisporus var. burnettii JB137-S8]|uniref:F-box domain-containing protein n=1 Tax=Agaricus bisporus var. burnettii (strain JB137-S8 / ATCC MYA-4627 / FGSC 10392) TaxID=597362 RepID=K5X8T8_AGABU|nr:uncharacterized protein AGABI1DRAFT_89062 [Agaricus bisporus var. burnettii JB137-S8]EKM84346.1 hypothetical protein AGABI1DRAFT_89062 [Agaricus bisporus var. burnettii JB137-S8]